MKIKNISQFDLSDCTFYVGKKTIERAYFPRGSSFNIDVDCDEVTMIASSADGLSSYEVTEEVIDGECEILCAFWDRI